MARRDFLFVGCLNRRLPYFPTANGRGIAVFAFDPGSGGCRPVAAAEGIASPSYLSFDPRRCCLYATSEIAGADEGTVTAYRFDPVGGNLDQINSRPTLGGITAHCSLSQDGRFLLVANYGNGPADKRPGQAIAVFPIRGDGGLDAPSGSIRHLGSGPNAARQERPHAHCAGRAPMTGWLWSPTSASMQCCATVWRRTDRLCRTRIRCASSPAPVRARSRSIPPFRSPM